MCGKIYKLVPKNAVSDDISEITSDSSLDSDSDSDTYIGSTTKPLNHRLNQHKSDYKRYLNGKRGYVSSFSLFERYGDNGIEIILVENVDDTTNEKLKLRERYHIKNTHCCNKVIPCRTRQEYNQDNKEYISEQKRKYKLTNKERIAEQGKQYRQNNREYLSNYHKQYQKTNKQRIADYQQQHYRINKERIAEREKLYRQLNKQHIEERKGALIHCPTCGCHFRRDSISRHNKSNKHIDNINSQQWYYYWDDGTECTEEEYYQYCN